VAAGDSLVAKAMPQPEPGKWTWPRPRGARCSSHADRIVLLIGMPLMAIFQPFLPGFPVAVPLLGYWFCSGSCSGAAPPTWRAREGRVAVIVEHLRNRRRRRDEEDADALRKIQKLLRVGHIVRLRSAPTVFPWGRTLAEMNVGSLSGATILVILRAGEGDDSKRQRHPAAGTCWPLPGLPMRRLRPENPHPGARKPR